MIWNSIVLDAYRSKRQHECLAWALTALNSIELLKFIDIDTTKALLTLKSLKLKMKCEEDVVEKDQLLVKNNDAQQIIPESNASQTISSTSTSNLKRYDFLFKVRIIINNIILFFTIYHFFIHFNIR